MSKRDASGHPPARKKGRVVSSATCPCGTTCEPTELNWYEVSDPDDRGDVHAISKVCMPCGTYCISKNLKIETHIAECDNVKGKKKVGQQHKLELEQHKDALINLSSRKFALKDVVMETISGSYSDERAGFSSIPEVITSAGVGSTVKKTDVEAALCTVHREFPSGHIHGIITDSTPGTVEVGASSSVDSAGHHVVRYVHKRVVMTEVLLDAQQVLIYTTISIIGITSGLSLLLGH